MKNSLKKFMAVSALMIALMITAGMSAVKTQAASLTNLKQTANTANSITVQWSKTTSSYETIKNYTIEVREYYGSSDYRVAATNLPASTTQYTLTGLKAGTKYYVKVTANYRYQSTYSSYDRTTYSTLYDAETVVSKVTGLKQIKWYYFIKQFDAGWDKQDAADGYEVQCLKSSGKKHKGNISISSDKATIYKISNDMIYTVRVRAFQNVNGNKLYGAWSDPIYCFTQPRITALKVKGGKLTLKWKKVSGATGYKIFVSTNPKTGYKKVKKVSGKKNSVTIKKFKGKKFKNKKNYYVYVQTLKKVNGKMNTSGQLYYWETKKPASSFGYLN